ncbi:MAG: response regulator [Rhizobacter sp.]|nr:response regulator [Chlorobiales bacterium]
MKRLKLIAIDDEPHILESISQLFDATYDVMTASSGQEAIELVRHHLDVAVVVSDQRMPGMKGVEALKQIRAIAPDTVRILLTGYADLDAILDSVNVGEVFRYVRKPWEPDTLKSIVAAAAATYLLRRRKFMDENFSPLATKAPLPPPTAPTLPPIAAPETSEHKPKQPPRQFDNFEEEFFASLNGEDISQVVKYGSFEEEFMDKLEKEKLTGGPAGDSKSAFEKSFHGVSGKPKVLIVDDEVQVLTSLRQLLEPDYELIACGSADEALAVLREDAFVAVVLSDQRMPKKSGADFLVESQDVTPMVPKILMTAYTDVEDIVRLINEGQIFRYIQKPWDGQALREVLAEAVTEYRRRIDGGLKSRGTASVSTLASKPAAETPAPASAETAPQGTLDKLKALSDLRKKQ